MTSLAEYLKKKAGYTPPASSLAGYLEKQKTKNTVSKTTTAAPQGYQVKNPITGKMETTPSKEWYDKNIGLLYPGHTSYTGTKTSEAVSGVSPRTQELMDQLGAEPAADYRPEMAGAGAIPEAQEYSSIWKNAYDESGMEGVKTQISGIDTDITNRKAKRDQALLDEKGKPIPQWMITGRKALEIEAATGDLNTLIDQRNTLADQFNTGLGEVERKASYAISYQKEMQRQLESERSFGLQEKLYELREAEAAKPAGYTPPTSYKEWELAGKPGTFQEWVSEDEEEIRVPTQEDFANMFVTYKDAGYTKEDIERQYRAENKIKEDELLPTVVRQALDIVFEEEGFQPNLADKAYTLWKKLFGR